MADELLPVIQADRDAAASIVAKTEWSRGQYRTGKRDKTPAVQAFARHRTRSSTDADVLTDALYFAVCTLAFHGRDRGTDRQEKMLDDLEALARDLDPRIRAAQHRLSKDTEVLRGATSQLELRGEIARLIALAGLGTVTGDKRLPNGDWKPDEFEARILEIIPGRIVTRCLNLADAILSRLSPAIDSADEPVSKADELPRLDCPVDVDDEQKAHLGSLWTADEGEARS